MIRYHDLRNQRRRRRHRMLAEVRRRRVIYVRSKRQFRMTQRLHRASFVTACESEMNPIGPFAGRPFREPAGFATEVEAKLQHRHLLSRR